MGAHGNLPLLGEAGDRRWLLRGIGAGAGAMVAAVIVAMVFVTAFIGDAGQGWAERGTMTAVLFTGCGALRRPRRAPSVRGRRPSTGRRISRRRVSPARSGQYC